MQLFIKNMVCRRCQWAVEQLLLQHQWTPVRVELGEVEIAETLPEIALNSLRIDLEKMGFELIYAQKQRLIERIKQIIIDWVRQPAPNIEQRNLSAHLSAHLYKDYGYLSHLFSDSEQMTIEHFYILQKIEYVKELLSYEEKTLAEIAEELQYSSTAHLSQQFKKITGLTPSTFKKLAVKHRQSLDMLGKSKII